MRFFLFWLAAYNKDTTWTKTGLQVNMYLILAICHEQIELATYNWS